MHAWEHGFRDEPELQIRSRQIDENTRGFSTPGHESSRFDIKNINLLLSRVQSRRLSLTLYFKRNDIYGMSSIYHLKKQSEELFRGDKAEAATPRSSKTNLQNHT